MWERELADLNTEMERLQEESEETTQRALQEEVSLYIFINSISQPSQPYDPERSLSFTYSHLSPWSWI